MSNMHLPCKQSVLFVARALGGCLCAACHLCARAGREGDDAARTALADAKAAVAAALGMPGRRLHLRVWPPAAPETSTTRHIGGGNDQSGNDGCAAATAPATCAAATAGAARPLCVRHRWAQNMYLVAAMAQSAARRSHNPKVVSSILTGRMILSTRIAF